MSWKRSDFISVKDLYIAYRKAKVDMFYEREHVTAQAFAEYEEDLAKNIADLFALLNSDDPQWPSDPSFVGGYTYIPKSVDIKKSEDSLDRAVRFVSSNPDVNWRQQCGKEKPEAKFRLVGRHPVQFHIVSSLWIQKVGHKYDAILDESAYGSRLRRRWGYGKRTAPPTTRSLGNFRPYSQGFIKWRSDGLDAMREALDKSTSVIAVTADLRSFYHEVSPEFLLSQNFLERFSIELRADERLFTEQFVKALRTWAAETPDHKESPRRGLPVGLSAPRLIANVVLAAFDKFVYRELSPLYYGRYVDDVFLVLGNQRDMRTSEEVWKYIIDRSNGLLQADIEDGKPSYRLNLSYSSESRLRFAGDKQKVFCLEGSSGKALLGSIERTIRERSSEWRLLPDLPKSDDELASDFIAAGRDATEEVDNLRKAEGITIQRLAFALRLRNFEAIQRDLKPSQWEKSRANFYQLALDNIITAPGLFAYGSYVPRLLSLAISCGDWGHALAIIKRLDVVLRLIRETTSFDEKKIEECRAHFAHSCYEALIKALPPDIETPDSVVEKQIEAINRIAETQIVGVTNLLDAEILTFGTVHDVRRLSQLLFEADLGRRAFREFWLDPADFKNHPIRSKPIALPSEIYNFVHGSEISSFLDQRELWKGKDLPRAVVFPTRPFTPAEITLLDQRCLQNLELFLKWVSALRGGSEREDKPDGSLRTPPRSEANVIEIPDAPKHSEPKVALPCLLTTHESWVSTIACTPDPDPDRYFRINRLINEVLRAKPRVQYLVFPELALPRRWFNRISHKLTQSGVSLIAGLEYLHWDNSSNSGGKTKSATTAYVANQVRASLVTNYLGYRSHMIYVQEKERPAPAEERDLEIIAGKTLKAKDKVRRPVIRHGDFHFGILICSELTNIDIRKNLRGKVDVLFIPEWNKDTSSFSSLVEASALDLHCYIVQANNREYGDCRVRAPFSKEFRRDVARIKGGDTDYFVIATIDVSGLRAFQSFHRSPEHGEYKPVPDGFRNDPSRTVRPA